MGKTRSLARVILPRQSGRAGVFLLAALLLAAPAAFAGQPRTVTTQPLTMTGLGGNSPTATAQPFTPKNVTMAALTMIGISGSGTAAASQTFLPKSVRVQMLTMTGTRGGPVLKLPLGLAPLLKLPTPGKKP